jgi:hypothetical protein
MQRVVQPPRRRATGWRENAEEESAAARGPNANTDDDDAPSERDVYLNVYDLNSAATPINGLARLFAPSCKSWWGAFHVGVEVYGDEWSFGQTLEGGTGVVADIPRKHPVHIYRESVFVGETTLSRAEVWAILCKLKLEWPGDSYDILNRNCITFSDEFTKCLGVGRVPEWMTKLQENLSGFGSFLSGFTKLV